jgi:hypothetical protein
VKSGQPAAAKFYRLDNIKLAAAGIIRHSSCQWSSPLHMVRKKDGGWRPCGDYRRLNLATQEDKYSLPNMGDLASRLDGCLIFSKLDLRKGYLQAPVAEEDIPKKVITTPFGLFEFTRMPFGLWNTGMTFQRLIDNIFFKTPAAFGYLDDLLIGSRSAADHRHQLHEVLQWVQNNGLLLNLEKCIFGQQQVEFLGHSVSAAGVLPLPDRVAAIRSFEQPRTVEQLQAFLGLFNFYRRFIPAAAKILRPLTDSAQLQWSAAMEESFAAARSTLADTALLDHPSADAELSLATDASASHVSGVLKQRRPGRGWTLLVFFQKNLRRPK